ncbi:YbfB/YjiJ family MFS transporter [Herbaspirillum sp. GCM10030257]|uniref:YbfB/YjiJ family MFS transporter n=1 Tax=Herbaspirillum sp. GCM10030257 TaxID=3273393 RepID=UPI003616ACED
MPSLQYPVVLRETLAAAVILAVGMGFGRFAYTGMYPLMVRDGLLSVSTGSMAASANYAGYLVGALLVSRTGPGKSAFLCKAALAGTVLCLAALAHDGGPAYIITIRLIAGIISALAMVSASAWLFQVVGNTQGAPLLYAGVGVGIMMSAETIAIGNVLTLHSSMLWLGLTVGSGILCAFAWRFLTTQQRSAMASGSSTLPRGQSLGPWSLIAIYGLAGFGYIITATYLPLFVRNAIGMYDPIHIWAAFGLGAAPSCFLWHQLQLRFGTRRALVFNLIVQAVGVMLPIVSKSPLAFLLSALLVGGTFMGTVTIAMPAARHLATVVSFNIFAVMTAAYGIGQIIGPLLSDALYRHTQTFDAALWVACGALLLAAAISLKARARPHS